ncbi:Fc receptor-like protein 5 [Paramisgurnus dabryanus]|uniref:Fc receptor-like protein 5 n=1 Tax=Paramisgurnus dabryanus TaxID=90735 RepID=UPI003CCF2D1A
MTCAPVFVYHERMLVTLRNLGPAESSVTLRPRLGYVPKVRTTPFRDQVVNLQALPPEEADPAVALLCPKDQHLKCLFGLVIMYTEEKLSISHVSLMEEESAAGSKYTCKGKEISGSRYSHISNAVTLTVSDIPRPSLTVQPQKSVFIGDSVTLTCEVHQSTGWEFIFRNPSNTESTELTGTKTIRSVQISDGGEYWCRARRKENPQVNTQYSQPITVTVQERPTPQVSVWPDDHVFRGETVTLTCVINGGGVNSWEYRWYKDSIIQQNKLQYYIIRSVTESDAGKYTCRATEISGSRYSHISNAVTLRVSGSKPKPKLRSDTEGSVLTGNTVTLKCHIYHWSTGWKFHWYKNTQNTEKTTTETNSYTIHSVKVSDGGRYWCRAGRGKPDYYTDYSYGLWINVKENPKPVVCVKPDKQLFRGETVTLRCDIQDTGDTEWTYSWTVEPYNRYRRFYCDTQECKINNIQYYHSGKYTCRGKIREHNTEMSDAVTLTVSSDKPKPVLSVSPQQWLTEGDSVTLMCKVRSSSTGWTFSWFTVQSHSPGKVDYQLVSDSIQGSKGIYTVSSVTVKHTGVYMCRAERGDPVYHTEYSNTKPLWITGLQCYLPSCPLLCSPPQLRLPVGWALSSVPIQGLQPRPSLAGVFTAALVHLTLSPLRGSFTPSPQTSVFNGDTVTLSCEVHCLSPVSEFVFTTPLNHESTESTGTKTIKSVQVSDGGQYLCRARIEKSPYGNMYYTKPSKPVTVTVQEKPTPQVSVWPDDHVFRGETVNLTCVINVGGDISWQYSWYKDDSDIQQNKLQYYTIRSVSESDAGNYTCRGTEISGSRNSHISNAVTLTVSDIPRPTLTVLPQMSVFSGDRVTLTCEVHQSTGWEFIFINPLNTETTKTTGTKTIRSVQVFDGGEYNCRARRKENKQVYTEDSEPITVTVENRPTPQVSVWPDDHVYRGETVNLTCVINGGGCSSWQYNWYKDSIIQQNKLQHYTIRSVTESDAGKYTCRGTEISGSRYSHISNAVTLTVSESPKPVVSVKPDKQLFSGETVTLRCDIQDTGDTEWTYSWTVEPYCWYRRFYCDTQECKINNTQYYHSGKYTCRGKIREQNTEMSDAVTLTVSSDKPQTVLSVSPQQWLTEGDSVTLMCEVRSSSTGWTFSWFTYKARTLFHVFTEKDDYQLVSDSIRGSKGIYTVSSVTVKHTGVYGCRAERGDPVYHTEFSNTKPLFVNGVPPSVSLIIKPSRSQHFINKSLSLSCEDHSNSAGWTVRRYTDELESCSSSANQSDPESTCLISSLNTSDTGVYWCQSESGVKLHPVNISVYDVDVILESPVHPVTEGDPLTLRCLYRNKKPSNLRAEFYKYGSVVQNQTTGNMMIIPTVSKSHEGFYYCKYPERGESPKSWISVRARASQVKMSGLKMLSFLLAVCPYLLATAVLVFKCCRLRVRSSVEDQLQNAVREDESDMNVL